MNELTTAHADRGDGRVTASMLISIVKFSVSAMASSILGLASVLLSTFWAGRLGSDAIATMAMGSAIVDVPATLASGFTVAGAILIAQYTGARDAEMSSKVIGQTLLLTFSACVIIALLGIWLAPEALKTFFDQPHIYADALYYARMSFLAMVASSIFGVTQALIRSRGEVTRPLVALAFTSILNAVLDPILMFGLGPVRPSGVGGLAIAMLVMQSVGAAIGIRMLAVRFSLRREHFRPDPQVVRRIFLLGLPASICGSANALGGTLLTMVVTRFGTVALAVFSVGMQVINLVVVPALGLQSASTILVGQSIGSNKIREAERVTWAISWMGFALLSAAGIVIYFFPLEIIRFFIPNDASAYGEGVSFVRIGVISYGAIAIELVVIGALTGAGATTATLILSIISYLGLRLPLAYFLSNYTSLHVSGIWWAISIEIICTAIIASTWFAFGSWKKIDLTGHRARARDICDVELVETIS